MFRSNATPARSIFFPQGREEGIGEVRMIWKRTRGRVIYKPTASLSFAVKRDQRVPRFNDEGSVCIYTRAASFAPFPLAIMRILIQH